MIVYLESMNTKNKKTTKQEIERLVKEYPTKSKDVFRMELERLVLIAQREQMIKDQEGVNDILSRRKK